MKIERSTNIKISLHPSEVADIIRRHLSVQGYQVPSDCISFDIKEDYSDPDADRYGPTTIFTGVTCNFKNE